MQYDVVIIGSGVAGLTASIYTARAGKSVLIIEEDVLGGTTATLENIQNYPGFTKISGFELIQNIYNQALDFGVNFEYLSIKLIDFDKNVIITDNNTIKYTSLIIASGTSYKRLGVENEDKYRFKGLSYCAICDGMLYKNKKIAIVTSGDSGNDAIEYLSNITNNISIIDLSDKCNNKVFPVYRNSKITKLLGDNLLLGVEFVSNNSKHTINFDGIFISLGKETNLSLYKDYLDNDGNFLITNENMHTNIPNVFVAGDIRKKTLRQIVTACSDGAIAGTEAVQFVSTKNKNAIK